MGPLAASAEAQDLRLLRPCNCRPTPQNLPTNASSWLWIASLTLLPATSPPMPWSRFRVGLRLVASFAFLIGKEQSWPWWQQRQPATQVMRDKLLA